MDNISLFFWVFGLSGQNAVLDALMKFGAEPLIYLMVLITLLLTLKGKTNEKKTFLLLLFGIPIAVLLIKVIHLFFLEPRPFVTFNINPLVKEATDASFPSRHATISSVIAFSYIYFKSKWSLPFLFVAAWIGFSRVYVGVHYPLDIIGGFLTGITALIISIKIKNLLRLGLLPTS